jgi:hypothetical protein
VDPCGYPWVRLPLLGGVVLSIVGVVVQVVALAVSEGVTVLVLIALTLPTYPLAVWGVRQTRQGASTGDWGFLARLWPARAVGVPVQRPFASPLRAQFWLERRLHLPLIPFRLLFSGYVILIVIVYFRPMFPNVITSGMFPELIPLSEWVPAPWIFLILFLLVPLMDALIWGAEVERVDVRGSLVVHWQSLAISSFLATRPVTVGFLLLSKLVLVTRIVLIVWLPALGGLLYWFLAQDGVRELMAERPHGFEGASSWEVGLLLVSLVVASVLITWFALAQGLWSGLLGKPWFTVGNLFVQAGLGLALYPLIHLFYVYPEQWDHFSRLLPCLLLLGVLLKGGLAVTLGQRVIEQGLLSGRQVVVGLLVWLAAALPLWGLLVWGFSAGLVLSGLLACSVFLFLPLTRLLLAPLTLAWNWRG